MIDLLFDFEDYEGRFKSSFLKDAQILCESILEQENIYCECEISISLVSSEEIQSTNKRFRKIDKSTDVLSFPQYSLKELEALRFKKDIGFIALGDIIISFDQAVIQSKENNHSLERELIYLTCHSMFHLLGYDHMIETEKEIMRKKEEEILMKLGFSREY